MLELLAEQEIKHSQKNGNYTFFILKNIEIFKSFNYLQWQTTLRETIGEYIPIGKNIISKKIFLDCNYWNVIF